MSKKEPPDDIHQFDLYARTSDPVTSHEAQLSMSRSTRRVQIVHIHARFDGPPPRPMTSFDVAEYLGCPANNASNYFKPLEGAGYLQRVGFAPADPARKRKRRTLWILTNKGRRFCKIPEQFP